MAHTHHSTPRQPAVLAVVGKGGVGKTTFAFLLARALIARGRHPLLIDADPSLSHLARALGVAPEHTIEGVRAGLIGVAARGDAAEKARVAREIDSIVARSVMRSRDYDLLVLGQPTSAGCFCPSNTLLRSVIHKVIGQYDSVIIDCEAGLEQIHRQVISTVDYIVIVSDPSTRGFATAEAILASARRFTNFKRAGLVVNRVPHGGETMVPEWVEREGVHVLGALPDEPALREQESRGSSLAGDLDLPALRPAFEIVAHKIID
ncbi:MAG: AAA family ATPase [Candidatus Lokiarchaeota archaeon]|nr:AAA family ATPase [Candidatus Lokiarchaeota archaeon]